MSAIKFIICAKVHCEEQEAGDNMVRLNRHLRNEIHIRGGSSEIHSGVALR